MSLEEGRDLAIQRMALFYVETSSMLCTGTTDLIDTVWEALGSVARSVWPKTSTSLTETSSMDSTLDAGSEDEQDSALLAPAQEIAQNMDAKPSLHSHTDSTHSKSQLSSPPSSPPQKSSYPDRPQQRSNQGHMQVRADFLDLPNERGRIDMLQTRSVTSGGGILQDTRPALDPSFSMDSGKVFSHQEDRYLDNDRVSIEYFPPSSHPRPAYPPDKRRKSGWKSFFKNFSQGQEQQHSQKQKYSMPPQSQYSLPARQSLQRPVPVQYQYHQHTQHTQPMQYMQSQNRRSMGEMRSQKTNFWTKLFGPRNGV